jgi:hypothetical protein
MSATLTSSGISFSSDSSSQSSAGVPPGGGTMSGIVTMPSLIAANGFCRQWSHSWTHSTTANTSVDLLYNTGGYSDVHFMLILYARTGSNGFYMWDGIFGGYGGQYGLRTNSGDSIFTLAYTDFGGGYGKISVKNTGTLPSSQGMSAVAYFYNHEGVAAYVGTIKS